jgi:hypothetical protein
MRSARLIARLSLNAPPPPFPSLSHRACLSVVRFIQSSLSRWKSYVSYRKDLIRCLAKECVVISETWRMRFDERRRREEERREVLEREREAELERIREEEEDKKIRGYDRMDKIYAMWKQAFDGNDASEDGEKRGERGDSIKGRPKSAVGRMFGSSSVLSSRQQSLPIGSGWVEAIENEEQNKTKEAMLVPVTNERETFSLDDFILKHDLNETEIQKKISTVCSANANAADGWIKFRSQASLSQVVTATAELETSQRQRDHEAEEEPFPLPQTSNSSTSLRSKRSKDRGKTSHHSSSVLEAISLPTPSSPRDWQQEPQQKVQRARVMSRSQLRDLPLKQQPQQRQELPSSQTQVPCLPSPPSSADLAPVSSLPTLFPQQQGWQQQSEVLESKINEIYSEYDDELQAFWNKITQQKQQQQHQQRPRAGAGGSSSSRPSSATRRRPKSANQSSRADRNRVPTAGAGSKAPKVELYGYGFEDFHVEDAELIGFQERPRSATTTGRSSHLSASATATAAGTKSRNKKFPEPPEYHTRASSSSSRHPQNRKGRQMDPVDDPYNFQEY